ncbi:hypothetical protein IAT38_002061 [Cryptococcus sp. DSM 104549]
MRPYTLFLTCLATLTLTHGAVIPDASITASPVPHSSFTDANTLTGAFSIPDTQTTFTPTPTSNDPATAIAVSPPLLTQNPPPELQIVFPNSADERALEKMTVEEADEKRLTNAERFAIGLPPKKPKRKFDPTRTRILAPRASAVSEELYIRVNRVVGDEKLGYLSYDLGNGALMLPQVPAPVTFFLPEPGVGIPVTIRAYNSYASIINNVVTRDWTNPEKDMGTGNPQDHTTLFGVQEQGDEGDPIAFYQATKHESSVWLFDELPGRMRAVWTNMDGTTASPKFYLDRTSRRILRIAMAPGDIRLGLDDSDEVYLTSTQEASYEVSDRK